MSQTTTPTTITAPMIPPMSNQLTGVGTGVTGAGGWTGGAGAGLGAGAGGVGAGGLAGGAGGLAGGAAGGLTVNVPDKPLTLTVWLPAASLVEVKVNFWLAWPARVTVLVDIGKLSTLRVTS